MEPLLTRVRAVVPGSRQPVAGALVLVNDASGALLSAVRTDPQGIVNVDMPVGGSISTVSETQRRLATAFQPEPGRPLEMEVGLPEFVSRPVRSPMTLTITVSALPANASSYWSVDWGCASRSTSETTLILDDFDPCGHDQFDLLAFATRDGELVGWAGSFDRTFVAGGSITLTMQPTDPNVRSHELHVEGIPPGSPRLDFDVVAYRKGRSIGHDFDQIIGSPNTDETLRVRLPLAGFERFVASGRLQLSTSPFYLESYFVRTGGSVSLTREWYPLMDVAAFEPVVDVDDDDANRPQVSWALREDGALGDVVWAELWWGEAQKYVSWRALLPPARSLVVKLPEFPEELAELRPAGIRPQGGVVHYDVAETVGYQATLERQTEDALWRNADYSSLQ
jgi:hypothetical protein